MQVGQRARRLGAARAPCCRPWRDSEGASGRCGARGPLDATGALEHGGMARPAPGTVSCVCLGTSAAVLSHLHPPGLISSSPRRRAGPQGRLPRLCPAEARGTRSSRAWPSLPSEEGHRATTDERAPLRLPVASRRGRTASAPRALHLRPVRRYPAPFLMLIDVGDAPRGAQGRASGVNGSLHDQPQPFPTARRSSSRR